MTSWPLVPDTPTHAEALAALDQLVALYVDFPFVAASDRSSALALLLTVVGRQTIDGLTPLFAVRATAAGTGKGLVVDVVAAVALGLHEAKRLGAPESDDETEKQLLSLGREATPLVMLDNLTRPLGNGVLARAITSRTFSGRALGHNRTIDVPMPVLAATGNNLQVASDLHRRVLPIDLESQHENPENRTGFKIQGSLIDYCLANRPRLLVAALTVLRWWHAAGRPEAPLSAWGSFEAWSRAIRSPLVLLGMADPCGGVARLREESDPEREGLATLLRVWADEVGAGRAVTVAELVQAAGRKDALRDALCAIDSRWHPDLVEARNLIGQGLKARRGRILGGLRLEAATVQRGTRRWVVVRVGESTQKGGQDEAWEPGRE